MSYGICVILLVVFSGITVHAMEFGGFDVTVGAGENFEYPEGWWEEPQEEPQEELQGEPQEQPQEKPKEEPWEETGWNEDTFGDDMEGSWGEAETDSSGSVPDSFWYEAENGADQNDGSGAENISGGNDETENGFPGEGSPTPAVTKAPSLKAPSLTPDPGRVTVTPEPEITRKPLLTEYRLPEEKLPRSTIERILAGNRRKKLQAGYWKEKTGSAGKAEIHLETEGGFHILSLRMNGKECAYHWEGNTIVLEQEEKKKDKIIEMIALYEAGCEIQVWTE